MKHFFCISNGVFLKYFQNVNLKEMWKKCERNAKEIHVKEIQKRFKRNAKEIYFIYISFTFTFRSFAFLSYFFHISFAFLLLLHFINILKRPHLKCKRNVSRQCFLNISEMISCPLGIENFVCIKKLFGGLFDWRRWREIWTFSIYGSSTIW